MPRAKPKPDPLCPACAGTWPAAGARIADCGSSVAYLHDDQFFPGWTVLVLKAHVTELFTLAAPARHALVDEVSRVAGALRDAFDPVKVNYALLGNQIPHIHWHLVPRLDSDPAPLAPVWSVAHEAVTLAAPAREERIARIRAALGSPVAP